MSQSDQTSARERRLVRDRANQIQRAVAAIDMACEGLDPIGKLIAVNEVLRRELHDQRRRENAQRHYA